jgi:hypothetical protein
MKSTAQLEEDLQRFEGLRDRAFIEFQVTGKKEHGALYNKYYYQVELAKSELRNAIGNNFIS